MPDLIGQTIDHYRIERLLGQGGMGSIYQATDLKLQRAVAIKVMHDHLAHTASFQERFLQEARLVAQLDHPHIVPVREVSTTPQQLYIVMDFIAGGSLRNYVNRLEAKSQTLELDEALLYVRQIADALHYAHQHKMIHRDVKPENILLKPTSRQDNRFTYDAMLTDFGLAKLMDTIAFTVTNLGGPIGTLPYMSPEQCAVKPLDGRSDLYALGVVLYELTVGHRPFDPHNPGEAYRMHTSDPVPIPSQQRPNFSKSLEKIILICLAKDPNVRYKTADQLSKELSKLLIEAKGKSVEKTIIPLQPSGQAKSAPFVQPEIYPDQDSVMIFHNGQLIQVIPITETVMTIGRAPAQNIVLPHRTVSREHAVLECEKDGTYRIRDLGSTNNSLLGSTRLSAKTRLEWDYGQTLQIGEFTLKLHPGTARSIVGGKSRQAEGQSVLPSAQLTRFNVQEAQQPITVAMFPANIKVKAGDSVDIQVQVSNRGRAAEFIQLEIRGVPQSWAEISNKEFQIMPGQLLTSTITFTPVARSTTRAGPHIYTLRAYSKVQQLEIAKLTGVLHIPSFQSLDLKLNPSRLDVEGSITRLIIANNGNDEISLTLDGQDRENGLSFYIERQQLNLKPGETEEVVIEVIPRANALVHGAKLMPFEITATTADGDVHTAQGEVITLSIQVAPQVVPAPASAPALPAHPQPLPIEDSYSGVLSEDRERGGCLIFWLALYTSGGLLLIGTVILMSITAGLILSLNAQISDLFLIVLGLVWIVTPVYNLAVVQTWNWRRWAVYTLMFLSFFLFPIGPILTFVWWLLVRNKWSMFE